jgi:hypothetical protein
MAGCLAADGIASHRAAGTLWRLPEVEPRLEITIPEKRRAALKGFEVHRTAHLERVDFARRSGIPVHVHRPNGDRRVPPTSNVSSSCSVSGGRSSR